MNDVSLPDALATLKFGSVAEQDPDSQRVRVRLPELGQLLTAWLPVLSRKTLKDKDYWLPDIGEQVAVLLDARGEDGVVLGAIYSEQDAVPVKSAEKWQRCFGDGAVLEYDRQQNQLTVNGGVKHVVVDTQADVLIKAASSVTIDGGQTVTVKAGSKVSIKAPATEISGTLTVQGAITGQGGLAVSGGSGATVSGSVEVSGDVKASGKSLVGHNHMGAHGPTSPPL
ncbi:phage baseplate assembly protein V (plasmid) [Chromobacterium amazonense]|uniref:phage baseplate assembly protein V n=1 Tax=Chromobacterium amazonense TaxID=1382803 RepID=UPI00237D5D96|nr:phage baseplate assembly protein V [Chromobacterium amazonense]MDE1713960.1 phage baseplate assembly protein V [Chromobacterium amazonense]